MGIDQILEISNLADVFVDDLFVEFGKDTVDKY